MNFVVSSLSNKNPDKAKNEDLIGSYDNLFWLLDGASNPKTNKLTTSQYVQFLDQKLVETLQTTSSNIPLTKLVETSIKKVIHLIEKHSIDPSTVPSSTVVVVRIYNHKLEYFVLGDSSLIIQTNAQVECISDHRLQQIGTDIRSSIASMLRKGHGYSSPDVKKAKAELLQLQNIYRNQADGFYIASVDPNIANFGLMGEKQLNIDDNWTVALMSDGLSRLVDTFHAIPSWGNLITYLAETPATEVIHTIRSIEISDPDGRNFPRFRKHDDISMIMIQYNKVSLRQPCR